MPIKKVKPISIALPDFPFEPLDAIDGDKSPMPESDLTDCRNRAELCVNGSDVFHDGTGRDQPRHDFRL